MQTALKIPFSEELENVHIVAAKLIAPVNSLFDRWNKIFIVCSSLVRWDCKFKNWKVFILLRNKRKRSRLTRLWDEKRWRFQIHQSDCRKFLLPRSESVNQLFAVPTSATPWWWETCYEIKHLENDVKTFNSCEYFDKICPWVIISTTYLATNPFSWNYKGDLAMQCHDFWRLSFQFHPLY